MMFFKKITLFIFFFNLTFIIFSQNNDEDDFDLLFETDVEDVYLEQTKSSENVVSYLSGFAKYGIVPAVHIRLFFIFLK